MHAEARNGMTSSDCSARTSASCAIARREFAFWSGRDRFIAERRL